MSAIPLLYTHPRGTHSWVHVCARTRAHTHKHTFCSLSSSSSPEHNICSIIIITKIYYLSDPELTFYKKDSISPFQPHYKYNYYYLHFREENAFMYLSLICFSYWTSIYKKAIIDHTFRQENYGTKKLNHSNNQGHPSVKCCRMDSD